jgi:hypothetical protein
MKGAHGEVWYLIGDLIGIVVLIVILLYLFKQKVSSLFYNQNVRSMKRPIGLVLVVIYTLIVGVSYFRNAPLLRAYFFPFGMGLSYPAREAFSLVFMLMFGVFALTASYGLWSFKKWGHVFARILYAVLIPLGFRTIFVEPYGDVMSGLVGIAIGIITLIYLSKQKIKSLYDIKE